MMETRSWSNHQARCMLRRASANIRFCCVVFQLAAALQEHSALGVLGDGFRVVPLLLGQGFFRGHDVGRIVEQLSRAWCDGTCQEQAADEPPPRRTGRSHPPSASSGNRSLRRSRRPLDAAVAHVGGSTQSHPAAIGHMAVLRLRSTNYRGFRFVSFLVVDFFLFSGGGFLPVSGLGTAFLGGVFFFVSAGLGVVFLGSGFRRRRPRPPRPPRGPRLPPRPSCWPAWGTDPWRRGRFPAARRARAARTGRPRSPLRAGATATRIRRPCSWRWRVPCRAPCVSRLRRR